MAITQSTVLPLRYGASFTIAYHKTVFGDCVSVSYGDLEHPTPIVRIHSSCLFGESFHALDCDCAAQLTSTLRLIKLNRSGVLVYSYKEGRGVGLENKIKALELQRTRRINTVDAFKVLGFNPDARVYDAEIAALRDLQVAERIKIASQNPRKISALEKSGFTIVEQIHPHVHLTKYNMQELLAKKKHLGHNINTNNWPETI